MPATSLAARLTQRAAPAGAASSAADQVVETAGDAAEAVVDAASGTVARARDLIDGDGDEDAGDDGEERDHSPPA